MTVDKLLARESIRATITKYTIAGDRMRIDDFLSVFTEDAILESEYVPAQDAFRYEGLEQIKQWITRWRDGLQTPDTQIHKATFIRHHLATSQIELIDPYLAEGRTYWTAYTDIGPDHAGYYVDKFRKTNDAWLIAHRRVRLDWRAHNSLFLDAITETR